MVSVGEGSGLEGVEDPLELGRERGNHFPTGHSRAPKSRNGRWSWRGLCGHKFPGTAREESSGAG